MGIDERVMKLKPGKVKIRGFEGNARYQGFDGARKMVFIVRTGEKTISTITINSNNVNVHRLLNKYAEVSFEGKYEQDKRFDIPSTRGSYLILNKILEGVK